MERLRQNQSQPSLFEPQKVVGIDTAADRGFSAGILFPFGELSSGLWNRLRLGFQQEFRAGIGLSAWRAGDTDSNFPARNVSKLETKDKPMIPPLTPLTLSKISRGFGLNSREKRAAPDPVF